MNIKIRIHKHNKESHLTEFECEDESQQTPNVRKILAAFRFYRMRRQKYRLNDIPFDKEERYEIISIGETKNDHSPDSRSVSTP